MIEHEKITLFEFLRYRTDASELCVIRDCGWICAAAYIDNEDLFGIPERLKNKLVKNHEWGFLKIRDREGMVQHINVHYIDV